MSPMPRRRRRLLTTTTLVALIASGASAALGAPDPDPDQVTASTTTTQASAASVSTLPISESAPATQEFEDGNYVVVMREQPLATYDGHVAGHPATRPVEGQKVNAHSPAARGWANKLQSEQDEVIAEAGAQEPHTRFTGAVNGFAGTLTADEAATLAGDPLVLAVVPDEIRTLDTAESPEFLGLTGSKGVWQQVAGKKADPSTAGEGIVVGIVDSGIRPESPSFADVDHPAPPADWAGECETEDPAAFPADSCSDKLVGARYFVNGFGAGRLADYESLSPLDSGGHGTHTASTAAGNSGVVATIAGHERGTISGMAPGAHVAAYKACWEGVASSGCATSDTVAAINAAVLDGVDVINYSISGSQTSFIDPVEVAFLNAASAGVFVAASSGNSGPAASTTAHASPWITTVAASTHAVHENTVVLGDDRRFIGASVTGGMQAPAPFAYAGDLAAADATSADAALCLPGTLDAELVAGTVVLCDRGQNARAEKSVVVAEAGGVGMVLVNVGPDGLNADIHAVPTVHLPDTDRDEVLAYARTAGATAQVALGNEGSTTQVPQVAGFSSRGPSLAGGGDVLKPDLSAPGVDVLAAYSPTQGGESFMYSSGTSMSSPHIAGLAALVMQAHPDWSPMMIKSAMMTTTREHVGDTDPFAGGAGFVDPTRFLDPGLVLDSQSQDWWDFLAGQGIVFSDSGEPVSDHPIDASDLNLPSIAIGDLYGAQTVTRTLTDVSGTAGVWHSSVQGLDGLDVTVTPAKIRPGKGGTQEVSITINDVDAPANQWATGSITWTGPGKREVTIPVVVRPGTLDAPSQVTAGLTDTELEIPVRMGVNGAIDTRVIGLFAGEQFEGSAHHQPFFDGTDPELFSQPFTYPRGYPTVRIEVETDVPDADLDLYVTSSWSSFPVARAATSARNEVYQGAIYSSAPEHWIHVVAKGTEAERVPFTLRVFFPRSQDTGTLVMDPADDVVKGETHVFTGELNTDGTSPYYGRVEFLRDGAVVDATVVRVN